MKNFLIVLLLAIIVWMVLGMPMPDIQLENQYEFESSPATVIYHTPVYAVQPEQPVQPVQSVVTVVVPATPVPQVPTSVPTVMPTSTMPPEQTYGLQPTAPYSPDEVNLCRTLFNSGLKETIAQPQRDLCEWSIQLMDGTQ